VRQHAKLSLASPVSLGRNIFTRPRPGPDISVSILAREIASNPWALSITCGLRNDAGKKTTPIPHREIMRSEPQG
jgi:hypothetical protein